MILLALPAGVFAFILIVNFINKSGGEPVNQELLKVFQIVIPVISVLGLSASFFIGRRLLEKAREQPSPEAKLGAFQSMSIIKMACIEIPALVTVVAALLTHEKQVLLVAMTFVVVMILSVPAKDKILDLLQLKPEEKNKLM